MIAVFDVKDRLLGRAERRAKEAKEDAGNQAASLIAKAAANRNSSSVPAWWSMTRHKAEPMASGCVYS